MNFFENRTARFLPLIASLFFFAALWSLDFPKPYVDDLFYCGAGLNMAGGGDFSNPLMARQYFPSHYFFAYPPIHSYAIARWMKLFGIGARSLTGFQNLMYFLTAAATIGILRRHKVPFWLEFLVPLGVSAAFLPIGLRPEPLSVALTMVGFAMVECGCRRSAPVFLAFLLMFLGGATSPRLTIFSGALAFLGGFRLWQSSAFAGWKRWAFCACALAALLVAGLIFLLMINFRMEEFLHTFYFHARLVDGGKFYLLRHYFLDSLGKTQLPLYFLPTALFLFALRQPEGELFHHAVFIVFAFFLTALIGVLGHGSAWYALLMTFFLAVSISRNAVRHKILLPAALSLLLLLANGKSLVAVVGVFGGKIQDDHGGQFAEALRLRSTPEHPVLVDSAVARYVFDYKIPPGFLDFRFSAPFPGVYNVEDIFQLQDVYLVSPESADFLKYWTKLDFPPMPQWSLFGMSRLPLLGRWVLYEHPCEVFVIPAEACGDLRRARASSDMNRN